MTFVVTDVCINCKYTDCVAVCPVDCFYEGENMLVIHPDECIDCGVCEPECPIEAIVPDTNPRAAPFLEMNRTYSTIADPGGRWPVITQLKPPMERAEMFKDVPNKYPKFFSDKPGSGDK
jgi:ferredoxin